MVRRDLQIIRPIAPGASVPRTLAARLGRLARVYASIAVKTVVGMIAVAGLLYLMARWGIPRISPDWNAVSEHSNAYVVLACIAAPLLLTAIAVFLGWNYRRMLMREMHAAIPRREPHHETAAPRREFAPLDVDTIEKRPAVAHARSEALAVNAGVRRAYVISWLVYAVVTAAFMCACATPTIGWNGRAAITYAALAPQIMILTWSLRVPIWKRLLLFLGYFVAGVVLLLAATNPARTLKVLVTITGPFALFPMTGLVFLFIRRLQPFLVVLVSSVVVFLGFGGLLTVFRPEATVGSRATLIASPWLVPLGFATIVLGAVVTQAVLRSKVSVRWLTIALAVAGTLLLDRDLVHHDLPTAVRVFGFMSVAVLQMFFLWACFKLFVHFQQARVLTNELVHTHICWAFLTLYLEGSTGAASLYPRQVAVRWGFAIALVASIAALHLALFLIRRGRGEAKKTLLLLRVFGRADEREDLLDDLNDTWRRIGAIDLIAATDVASRTLQSAMLEAFVLRRSDEQFLRSESEVAERLAQRRRKIEGDARYPVNAIYCYEETWRFAFAKLVEEAPPVLMDLRGFTPERRSSAWELGHLVRHVDRRRIVILADRVTDREEIDRIVREAGLTEAPRILDFDRRTAEEKRALFDMLLEAAAA